MLIGTSKQHFGLYVVSLFSKIFKSEIKSMIQNVTVFVHRVDTTVKNARNMKSVSRAKPPYLEGIIKL